MSRKKVTVTITIDEEVREKLNKAAQADSRSRSAFVQKVLKEHFGDLHGEGQGELHAH